MIAKLGSHKGLHLSLGALSLIFTIQLCSILETPEDVEISIEAPTIVSPGEQFQIRARVVNTAPFTQVLIDLDIADEYLEGIVVESSIPKFSDAGHVPIDNTISYSFDIPIEAGAELIVIFDVFAAKVGDFSGEIDFCINDEGSCLPYPIRTIVE